VGVNFIVLGFAAMNRLHIEGVPQDKGNPFLTTEVRQPVPGEDALYADNQIVPIRSNDAQKRFGRRRQILVH
jgi:hypothetical protein